MQATETALKGCYIIEPRVFKDDRGYFFESFNQKAFEELIGQNVHFVQDNQSFSQYGVIRGIHFQKGAHAQAKLVRVLEGEVLDVAVDLREGSPTYGQHVAVRLNAENNRQLFVPRGFGHGFSVLSERAVFAYKCDNYYHKESEGGLLWNDPTIQIAWPTIDVEVNLSEKDQELTSWEHFESPF